MPSLGLLMGLSLGLFGAPGLGFGCPFNEPFGGYRATK